MQEGRLAFQALIRGCRCIYTGFVNVVSKGPVFFFVVRNGGILLCSFVDTCAFEELSCCAARLKIKRSYDSAGNSTSSPRSWFIN